ncbi:VOC family protein [uncultured Jannaschia sp.]|uniref:VOC family protein n=1 Tax=uncultured Jannaschia sp. TaxID=293347 RepID=UPI0026193DF9|nr:VOC family protein [uncultured Jannaschia sp.]
MSQVIFINLPVRDVVASARFYAALGFEQNHDFSGETAAAMEWGEVAVMLLDRAFYATFTDKKIIDARTQSGVLLCLPFESRAAVDDFHDRAARAGGHEARPVKDQSGMYGGAVEDPDGHTWETMWMDANAAPQPA